MTERTRVSGKRRGDASANREKVEKRPKALALLSGGLDSTLAAKLILDQGVEVEAINLVTPFCFCDTDALNRLRKKLSVKIHRVFLGQEFLDMVVDPPHGYGSQMNPCIDCRILMFKKAKQLAERIEADFLVTGEVLDERPFSQKKDSMLLIERKAGIEGKVLRPLSAQLLPETDPEKEGLADRDMLLAIRGRRRAPQIELAKKLNIGDYPNPSGGCLLTDPRFAERLREHLKNERMLTSRDIELLKLGRHFRVNGAKIIVGRNEEENKKLLTIAKKHEIPSLEAVDHMGPLTLLVGEANPDVLRKAVAITVRYSDAPRTIPIRVRYRDKEERMFETEAMNDEDLETLRV